MKKRISFSNVWLEARQLVWERRGRLALGGVLMLVSRISGMVLPVSSKWLIDDVLGKGRAELLPWLAAAAAVATVVQASTSFALSQVLGLAAQRTITEMRKSLQRHILRLPVSFFDSVKSGELISRIMTDAEGIRNLVGTGLVQLAGGLVTAALGMGVLFYLNWSLTLVILAVLGVFAVFVAMAFALIRPIFRERGKINADVTGRLGETLGGARIVKAYTAEKREDLTFARGAHRLFRNVAKTITAVSGFGVLANLVLGAVGVLMILLGGRAILDGAMTLGDLVTYVFFTGLVAAPLIQIANIATQLSEAFAGLDRIHEIRRLATEDDGDQERRPVKDLDGEVVFEGVSFEYEPGVPVLRNVSFRAPAGSTTALVGSSGAGKSTLINLIMAFNRPREGRILIDGQDLSSLRAGDYRRFFGVVLQDNFLFSGTIAENIAYSRPRADRAQIEAAGRVAHCDEFVGRLEKGYDTVVGERGVKLSGGQRQRVAIARAILADPRILILDEATSSLDSESEGLIRDGLNALRQGRTTFVIAHRLSTIRSANQILVIEDGRIIERGTHFQLMAAGGRYRQLHDKQHSIEEDLFVNPGEELPGEPEKGSYAAS